jgi:hypothetical protein
MNGVLVDSFNMSNVETARIPLPENVGLYVLEIDNGRTKAYKKVMVQ